MDYDSSTEEGDDEEYPPSQYLKSTIDHSVDNIPLNDMKILIQMMIQ